MFLIKQVYPGLYFFPQYVATLDHRTRSINRTIVLPKGDPSTGPVLRPNIGSSRYAATPG